MHLLESGEFLNVGLFCRVSYCQQGMLVYFYLKACCVFHFNIFTHFYYYFFFLYEKDAFW